MPVRSVSAARVADIGVAFGTEKQTPPVAKRRRVPVLDGHALPISSSPSPDLPQDVLSLIFTRVALDADGGMPSVLACASTCRQWRKAASRHELWRDIARKRWGYCEEDDDTNVQSAHSQSHAESDANRNLCLRLASAPGACVSYTRGRWWRAVAHVKRYRVTFRTIETVNREKFNCRKARVNAVALALHSKSVSRSLGDAQGWKPKHVTRKFDDCEDPEYADTQPASTHDSQASGHLNDEELNADGSMDGSPGDAELNGSDDDLSVIVDVAHDGAVVVTHHLLVLHLSLACPEMYQVGNSVSWREIVARTHRGMACVAVDVEVSDDDDDIMEEHHSEYFSRRQKPSVTKNKKWQRVTEFWARVGVTLNRCGEWGQDARLFIDGYARLSHVAPSTFSHELGRFGKKKESVGNETANKKTRLTFESDLSPVLPAGQGNCPYDTRDDDDDDQTSTYDTQATRFNDRDTKPGTPVLHPVLKGLRQRLCAQLETAAAGGLRRETVSSLVTTHNLHASIMDLEIDTERTLSRSISGKDLRAAAVPHDLLDEVIKQFALTVSFTMDCELDAAMGFVENGSDKKKHKHKLKKYLTAFSVTHSDAVVVPNLPTPRRFPNSNLATFRIGDGCAGRCARVLENATLFDKEKLHQLKCHVSFTHKGGTGYVFATGLRCDVDLGNQTSAFAQKSISKAPKALHFDTRHRASAAHGTGHVFNTQQGRANVFTPISRDDRLEVEKCVRVKLAYQSGADGFGVTGDEDPQLCYDVVTDTGSVRKVVTQTLNWSMEPSEFTRRGLSSPNSDVSVDETRAGNKHFANLFIEKAVVGSERFSPEAGMSKRTADETHPQIETPIMVQLHEASVSIGPSMIITVPLSALLKAAGRDGGEIKSGLEG